MSNLFANAPIIEKLNEFFTEHDIVSLAIKEKVMKRKPKKIDPHTFLLTMFLSVIQQASSLRKIAMLLGSMKNIVISKQAVDKRINEHFVNFLESILASLIARNITVPSPISSAFKRVVLQDSSTVRLPDHLAKEFPGNKNGKGKTYAMLKIQTMYNLLTEQFCYFHLTPFTTNDQHAATMDTECVEENDLIIRDLGYFVLAALTRIIACKAFFISRLRYGMAVYDPKTGKRLNLLSILKKKQKVDMPILLGAEEQLAVRLIAVPLDSAVAAERRRKLKNNRDQRLNPSKEHLALLGWNIFITNVDHSVLTPDEVLTFYQLRWRIEIIFKSWKSNFHLTTIPRASLVRVKAYLYAFLIFVTLFHLSFVAHAASRTISLLKLSRLVCEQFAAIVFFYQKTKSLLWEQINYHCAYEKRKDRLNYCQKFAQVS